MKLLSTSIMVACLFLTSCQRQYEETLQIVYRRNLAGNYQIMIMDEDGSNQHQITYTTNNDNPSWSADGEKIVFVINSFIYTMNSDGTGLKQITATSSYYPTWSPDGSKIAFYSMAASLDIFIINSDGTGLLNLTNNGVAEIFPSWFPDGTKIAFLKGNEIYTMNTDGTNQVQLTFTGSIIASFSWSPDGSRIVYENNSDSKLYVMNSDGTNSFQLPGAYTNGTRASWSPSGEKIVFSAFLSPREICIINSDGTGFRQLTSNGDDEDTPCFMGKPR